MKGPVRDSSTFSFNASAKTITFSAPIPTSQQQILAVLNVTRTAWLYLPVQAAYGGTWASPVLTVTASTTGHSNSDVLQIFVDDGLATTAVTGPLTDTQLRATAVPVSGTFFQATQPVSAASLPLPTGASTEATLSALNTKIPASPATENGNLATILGRLPANLTVTATRLLVDGSGVTQPVSGTFWQATQPVSAASLPLPSGAATAAKQPALGTAGTPSTDVLTVQGSASGTALPVAPNVTRGSGTLDANTQRVTLATDGATVAALASIDSKTPASPATAALQTTGNTSLSSIDGKLAALQSGAVPIGDNSGSLTIDGTAYAATVSFTRPANTTAYTAGDVIGTGASNDAIHTLSSIGSSGGYVVVQSIELVLGISAVPSGMTSFRVHFYDTSPTAAADNSVFDVASGDRAKYLGYIDLPAPVDLGSTCFTQIDYPGKLFKLASASASLFCELQTIGGFTPAANSEPYILRVKTLEAGK
jgi:hypothetical protein